MTLATCNVCRQTADMGNEPDPCLGTLPGVVGACCGHGKQHKAYVQFEDGLTFRGFKVEHHGRSRAYRNEHDAGIGGELEQRGSTESAGA